MRISDWSSDVCSSDLRAFASEIGITNFTAIPTSGFKGDNITALSENTPWFTAPALLEHLENVERGASADEAKPFRLPVHRVNRPTPTLRGFSGQPASGKVRPREASSLHPTGKPPTRVLVLT